MTLIAARPRVPEVTSLPAYKMLTDERLAKLAANGNRPAFETIYARYHDTLFRYCRSLVRDDEDARDALQNTMLNAMAAMHRRDRSAPLRPWLFRIAHNESISLLRRRRPSDSLDDESQPHRELADTRGDVHEAAVTREHLDQLLEDLGELTERQRGALVMRELGGLGYGEIASALDTSEPAVRQSVFAARSALHESAEGRDLTCSSVQSSISAGDRRSIRSRRVSAHLRACSACRDFSADIHVRRAHFGLLGPAPALAASMLQSIFGAGGGAAATGMARAPRPGGSAAAGSLAAKALVALAAVGAAAGGTVELTEVPATHAQASGRQSAAVHRSSAKAPLATAALPARAKLGSRAHRWSDQRTPAAKVKHQAVSKRVSYHWRGAHKDPSGPHPGTRAIRSRRSTAPAFTRTRTSSPAREHQRHDVAVRMIEQWKARGAGAHRRRPQGQDRGPAEAAAARPRHPRRAARRASQRVRPPPGSERLLPATSRLPPPSRPRASPRGTATGGQATTGDEGSDAGSAGDAPAAK